MSLDPSAGAPADLWHAYFSTHQPDPAVVSDLVHKLHHEARHEHVIAVIEAALANNQSQPWMYEVLALSMQIAGRPREDVDRVMLSRVDFTAVDVPNMMLSAAYLSRLGGDRQALHLYRQASRLDPTRPEAYVLGLKLARKLKDFDAVQWAASGILTNVWTRDHQRLHRDAENALLDVEQTLRAEQKPDAAEAVAQALTAAKRRDLVLRLTWNGDGDLDLLVEEPAGTVCSFDYPVSTGGGVLVHDGYGPRQENCYEHYVCTSAFPGDYRVRVRHVSGNIVGKRAMLQIIRYQGTPHETVKSVPILLGRADHVVRLSLLDGRRKELQAFTEPDPASARRSSRRRSLLEMVGDLDPEARRAARQFTSSRGHASSDATGTGGNVGFQPIISVLGDGVTMSALAVISADRRYVRLTITPIFTSITDVFTFSFVNTGGTGGGGTGGGGAGAGGAGAGGAGAGGAGAGGAGGGQNQQP